MPAADQVGEEPISYLHAVPEPKTGYGDEESPNPFPRPSRGLVPKVAPSEMRNVCLSKGKQFIERLRSLGNWNDIPLPFAEKRYGRGEEWIKGVLLFTYMGGLTLVINVILTVVSVALAYTGSSNSGNVPSRFFKHSIHLSGAGPSGKYLI
jgi:hypothetical protein